MWPSTVGRDQTSSPVFGVARLDAADDAELAAGHAGEDQLPLTTISGAAVME